MRRTWLLLLLLLPLASVEAQGPEVYTLTVTGPTDAPEASVEEPVDVQFTVQFESQNPMDGQNPRQIRVSITGLDAAGWTAQLDQTDLEMLAGDTETVTVTLGVSANAATEASFTVRADLVPFGLNQNIPTIGPIVDPDATGEADITVDRQESTTRQVVEAVGPWIWLILVAVLVLAILIAKLIADRRRIYVALYVDHEEVRIGPGKSIAVPIKVENLGRSEDTVVFHVANVDPGWSASLPVPELELDGGAVEEMQLIITAPKGGEPGTRHSVGISAHSAAAPRRIAEAVVTAVIE